MADLERRLSELDRASAPDQWVEIKNGRPRTEASARSSLGSGPSLARRLVTIATALVIGIAGVGIMVIAFNHNTTKAISYPSSPWSNGDIAVRELGSASGLAEIVSIDPLTGRSSMFSLLPGPLRFTVARLDMAWSPDGRILAIGGRAPLGSSYVQGAPGIWLLRHGQPPQQIESGWWEGVSWSPDGSRIAFVRSGDIYTMGSDGGGLRKQISSQGLGMLYPQWSPDSTRFTFTGAPPGPNEPLSVYVVNSNGTGLHKVAEGFGSSWAPDSRSLVFSSEYGAQLMVASADGSNIRVLLDCRATVPSCVNALAPTFAPDGRSILFRLEPGSCNDSGQCSGDSIRAEPNTVITKYVPWIVRLDGSHPTAVKGFSPADGIIGAAWQPIAAPSAVQPPPSALAGMWIALIVQGPSDMMPRLKVISPTGARIDLGPGLSDGWSPDCRALVYVRQVGAHVSQIVVTRPNSRTHVVLESSKNVTFEDPSWSPDGALIAYTASPNDGGPRDIQVIPAVGGRVRTLTPSVSDDFGPTWSPDGGRIAFIRIPGGTMESAVSLPPAEQNQVWTMRLDGTRLTRVTTQAKGAERVAWDRRSGQLAFDAAGWIYIVPQVLGTGSEVSLVSSAPAASAFPTWTTDGRLLVLTGGDPPHQVAVGSPEGVFSPVTFASTAPVYGTTVCGPP